MGDIIHVTLSSEVGFILHDIATVRRAKTDQHNAAITRIRIEAKRTQGASGSEENWKLSNSEYRNGCLDAEQLRGSDALAENPRAHPGQTIVRKY